MENLTLLEFPESVPQSFSFSHLIHYQTVTSNHPKYSTEYTPFQGGLGLALPFFSLVF